MGWFSDSFKDRTESPPKQGWFESDGDFRDRVYQEGKERIIEDATGSAPKRGWFELDDEYRSRIAHSANEVLVEKVSGSAPKQGFFELGDDYRTRIHNEANQRIVEDATGSSPKQGWFELNDEYHERVAREADSRTVELATGSAPKQGWFEINEDFLTRVNKEAKEIKASHSPKIERNSSTRESDDYFDNSYSSSTGGSSNAGVVFAGVCFAALILLLIYLYVEKAESQRQADILHSQREYAISEHISRARIAVKANQFEVAEGQFGAAFNIAADDRNLQVLTANTKAILYTSIQIPESGMSPPFAVEVSVYAQLNSGMGGVYHSMLNRPIKIFSKDKKWRAVGNSGRDFTPNSLADFLSGNGYNSGPFQTMDEAYPKIYFESTDGRAKKIYLSAIVDGN